MHSNQPAAGLRRRRSLYRCAHPRAAPPWDRHAAVCRSACWGMVVALRAQGHLVIAFAHMPLYGRDPRPLAPFDLILAGSRHGIASLHAAGIRRVHPEPLYAVAQIDRVGAGSEPLRARSRYDWDRRKLRDRALGALEPLWRIILTETAYARRTGLALGVVSRITPIKQFPLLFTHLAPILARYPTVQLEIFGSGGYASVRDLA